MVLDVWQTREKWGEETSKVKAFIYTTSNVQLLGLQSVVPVVHARLQPNFLALPPSEVLPSALVPYWKP